MLVALAKYVYDDNIHEWLIGSILLVLIGIMVTLARVRISMMSANLKPSKYFLTNRYWSWRILSTVKMRAVIMRLVLLMIVDNCILHSPCALQGH